MTSGCAATIWSSARTVYTLIKVEANVHPGITPREAYSGCPA